MRSIISDIAPKRAGKIGDGKVVVYDLYHGQTHEMQQITGLQPNPSGETIRLGPLAVRFLIGGENSSGSVAAFEVTLPCAQRLSSPRTATTTMKKRSTVSTRCRGGDQRGGGLSFQCDGGPHRTIHPTNGNLH